jgi:hypothetical protein
MVGEFFGQAQGLKDSLQALRGARDFQSVSTMLTELSSYVDVVASRAKTAFQEPQ